MKLKNIIRCIGINPHYVNSESQREQLKKLNGGRDLYEGGIANAYIYIPWSKEVEAIANRHGDIYPFDDCSVHGGVTYGSADGYNISEWHCPYNKVCTLEEYTSKWIVLGWDTNHCSDRPDSWTYQSIIAENEKLARQILDIINKELGV